MRVKILGSGTPTPTPDRYGSAFAVEVDDTILMFDCGPAATHKLVKAGVSPTDVGHLFFTHHHYDHNADYGCLLLCRWDQGADLIDPLKVYGPTHTSTITERLIGDNGAFAFDWNARLGHPLSQTVFVNRGGTLPRKPPTAEVAEIGSEERIETDTFVVATSHAQHVQPYLDSLAYRLETGDGRIVFTGDTEPCDEVEELANGADVLFAMCWDDQERMTQSGEVVGQMGTIAAADLAERAGVRTLVLVHTGPHLSDVANRNKVTRSIQERFAGEVVFGHEGMSLTI